MTTTAWHFDFHAHPDIALYLTHGRERWYINRFFDDLTYQPDAIDTHDLDTYAGAFEAHRRDASSVRDLPRALDHNADIHRADLAGHGKLSVPVLASGGGAQTLAANYGPVCEEIAEHVTTQLIPDAGHWSPRSSRRPSLSCSCASAGTSAG